LTCQKFLLIGLLLFALPMAPLGATVFAAPQAEPQAAPAGDDPPPPVTPDDPSSPGALPAPAAPDAADVPADTTGAGDTDGDRTARDAQADAPAPDKPYWRTNLFGRAFRDQKFMFTTWWPSEFKRPSFTSLMLAGVLLATTSNNNGGEGTDKELGDYIRAETHGATQTTAERFTFLGNFGPGTILIGAGYLIGRLGHNDRLAEATSLSAEALLTTGLYTTVLKNLSARTRPANGGQGDFFQYSPQNGQVPASFPSGHAAAAFTVAGVFSGVYSDSKWVPWVAYGTATMVGWSRVALHRHFPSDVLVGAVLGNSIGRMAVARNDATRPVLADLQPYYDPSTHSGGVFWTHRW
jgi:membrane-associated phospholipid phosphatase